jgi:hypothetical protein
MDRNTEIEIAKIICEVTNGCFLDGKTNILWKWIDNNWIGKPAIYTKNFRHVWMENIKNNDEIDNRFL